MYTLYNVYVYLSRLFCDKILLNRLCGVKLMKLRIIDILNQMGKTKYWLYIRLGLSYQNFSKLINNETKSIKFENLKALCDILECTPNDLFDEYYDKKD